MSTPLLLAAIGLAFLPAREIAIIPTVALWTLLVLGIEAAARRHLVGYLIAVLVLVRRPRHSPRRSSSSSSRGAGAT